MENYLDQRVRRLLESFSNRLSNVEITEVFINIIADILEDEQVISISAQDLRTKLATVISENCKA